MGAPEILILGESGGPERLILTTKSYGSPKVPNATGELSEWSKEPHSKCGIRITSYRGFESLTLRKAESSGNRVICRNDKRKSIGLPFVIVRISDW